MGLFTGFLKKINLLARDPTPEETAAIVEAIAGTERLMASAAEKYMDAEQTRILKDRVRQTDQELQGYRIPEQNPLYGKIQHHHIVLDHIDDAIRSMNQAYERRELSRADDILSDIDGKSLDDQQRAAVVNQDSRCLVLAGAGSGKTLTIAGKVKYLCQMQDVAPEEILLIAFTKKSAEEMTQRIADKMEIPVKASTFHKLGLDILTKSAGKRPEVLDELNVFLEDYFENTVTLPQLRPDLTMNVMPLQPA